MLWKVVFKLRIVSKINSTIELAMTHIIWLISFDSYYMTHGLIWKIVEPSKRFDQPLLYKSGMDCFHQGLKYEGWQFCWRGLGPTLIRAFPANAALFFTYQFVSDYLYRLDPDNFRHLGNSARRQPQASSWIFRVWISWLSYVEPFSVKDE